MPGEDFYGKPRLADGNGDGVAAYDIGADEFPGAGGWGVPAASTASGANGPVEPCSGAWNALAALLFPAVLCLLWKRSEERRFRRAGAMQVGRRKL